GILNNFPNAVFDSDKFCEISYPLQNIQYKDYAESVMINPSILGFSIVSKITQLDENITPYSERVQKIAQNSFDKKESVRPQPYWTFSDYIRILLRYKYGKLQPEDSYKKNKTHPDNTVQIYIENIKTTEFHLDDKKFNLLIHSGFNAARLWHEKFRNPKDFYSGTFHSVSKNLKLTTALDKKEAFYLDKLTHYFSEWMEELTKFKHLPEHELKHCISVQYTSFVVRQFFQKILNKFDENEGYEIITSAWYKSADQAEFKNQALKNFRSSINFFIYPNLLLSKLKQLLEDESSCELFQTLVQGHPQHVLNFIQNDENSLLNLVITKKIKLLPFLFGQIKQCCEQLASSPCANSYFNIVNALPKYPLLFEANVSNCEAIQICIDAGCDPCYKQKNGKTAIHHAIDIGNLSAFLLYVEYIRNYKIDLHTIRYGFHQIPLWHYIVDSPNGSILNSLLEEKHYSSLQYLYVNTQSDNAGVSFLEKLAQKGVYAWRVGMDNFSNSSQLTFTEIKKHVVIKKSHYFEGLAKLRRNILESDDIEWRLKKLRMQDLLALMDPVFLTEQDENFRLNIKIFYTIAQMLLREAGFQNSINLLELTSNGQNIDCNIAVSQPFLKAFPIQKSLSYIAQWGSAEDFYKKIIKYRANLIDIKQITSTPESASEKSPFHFLIDHKRLDIFKFLKERFEKQERKLYFDDLFDLSSERNLWDYAQEQAPELACYLLEYTRNEYFNQFKIVELTTRVNHLKL
ncbi:MAG TPA: ankyrin repeat domain-containing protein, partial [Gammaproteobacteria bacterium]|nr:ankyrin repeat domain-containing protein [Gammaproteobacteria bacterium]